jgi:imidazolonepropionase-like amidohydrolase
MKRILLLLGLLIVFSSCKRSIYRKLIALEGKPPKLTVLNVDIFNGKDSVLQKAQDVFIEEGRISMIAPAGEKSSEGYETIEGKGKVLMPGLIDAHVHLGSNAEVPWERVKTNIRHNLHAYLYAGIITIYDLGGYAKDTQKYSKNQREGHLIAPEIFFTHSPVTVPGGHPIPVMSEMAEWPINKMVPKAIVQIEKKEDAVDILDKYEKMEVDYLKIIAEDLPPASPVISYELMKTLTDEAHQRGYKVFVHIATPQQALMAIRAGADVLAHGIIRERLSEEEAREIAESQVPIIYTIAAFKNVSRMGNGDYQPTELDKEITPDVILDAVSGEQGKKIREYESMKQFHEELDENAQNWEHNVKLLNRYEAKFIMGTDSPLPGSYPGSGLHQEMQLLHSYGLSNFQILTGATSRSAKLFLDNPDFGTVEEGQKANLLLLKGNPLEDLKATQEIEQLILEGKLIRRIEPKED